MSIEFYLHAKKKSRIPYFFYKEEIIGKSDLGRFWISCLRPLVLLLLKLLNLSILSVPDEGYPRNVSCELNVIFTFLLTRPKCRYNVLGCLFCRLYDWLIGFWNCSDGVVWYGLFLIFNLHSGTPL